MPSPDRPTLRPFELGELIDRSITFWRQHAKPLFLIAVWFQLAEAAPLTVGEIVNRTFFPQARDLNLLRQGIQASLPQLLGGAATLVLALLLGSFVSQVSAVAMSHFSWQRLIGASAPTPAEAFRHAAQRLPAIASSFLLSVGWGLVVLVGWVAPGGVLGVVAVYGAPDNQLVSVGLAVIALLVVLLGAVGWLLWFIMRFVLLAQVIAVEAVSGLEAFRRSAKLSSGRVGPGANGLVKVRLMVLITIVGMVLMVVSTLSALPESVARAVFQDPAVPFWAATIPLSAWIPAHLLQAVLWAAVAPVYVVFQSFFYADMRARREGLDLELALDAAAPSPP